jgi:peptide/nickel transport system permease protein
LLLPLILVGVTMLIFAVLTQLSPAERSALYVRDIPHNPAAIDGIIKRYGLDDPIPLQYWRWLVGRTDPVTGRTVGGVLRGDFGYSRTQSQPVADLLRRRFPATLELALWSVVPIIGIGVWLGVMAAVNHNKPIDQFARIFSIVGWSFPSFVFGLLVLMFFYAQLRWFPPGRLSDEFNQIVQNRALFTPYTSLLTIDALLNWRLDIFVDALKHMVLPIITLSYIQWALLLKVSRSSMLETLRQEYVTVARAKGLSERAVIYGHALPNALIPVATLGGLTFVGLLNGVVITETIFNYPGMGSAAAEAAGQLDVITVLAFVLFNSTILVLANLVVDVLYAFIDPRVRLS